MRLISQDGKFDVPYENCVIKLYEFEDEKKYSIVARVIGINEGYNMAKYKSRENAIFVLDLLKREYIFNNSNYKIFEFLEESMIKFY